VKAIKLMRIISTVGSLLLSAVLCRFVTAYHRTPCTRRAAADFSFDDCYLPSVNPNIALSQASFVLAHDAATGYIQRNHLSPDGLTWSYTKTQVGSLYQQLQDGARAFDLRPKLWRNGTVVFHHGAITVPVNFDTALADVLRWCQEHPTEVVLLLTSHYSFGGAEYQIASSSNIDDDDVYDEFYDDDSHDYVNYDQGDKNEAMVMALQKIYDQRGVLYLSCSDVYGWTMETVKEQASLASGGIVLALDGKDSYPGSSCFKDNWVHDELVTCWTNGTSCKTSDIPYKRLEDYVLQSANNVPTDDSSTLGPPSNLYRYPLYEIQALWQVSVQSAAIGLAHFSNILADNEASRLHVKLVDVIHQESMPGTISLLAVDNVAVHGNALASVLRNRCGQSILTNVPCGPDLAPPRLHYWHVNLRMVISVLLGLYVIVSMVVFIRKRPHLLQHLEGSFEKQNKFHTFSATTNSKGDALLSPNPQAIFT